MIDIDKLGASDIGRWVVYHPAFGAPERGRIKSWGPHVIYVVYHCGEQWDNFSDYTAAATLPSQLDLDLMSTTPCAGDGGSAVEMVDDNRML
jgi:hypothetical protein